ncbi:MAG: glycosyltransferase [Candidatus Omnitrophica bacterium]|nr:glycosyltransferase [Candidatus Omnitrophota bacterium]
MKILVISKKVSRPEYHQKLAALSQNRSDIQVRILAPSFINDFKEGFKFYPDILWVDEDPSRFEVTKWLLLRRMFMPWSRVVASAEDNFFRRFHSLRRFWERFNYQYLDGIISSGKTVTDMLLRKRFAGKIAEIAGFNLPLGKELPETKSSVLPAGQEAANVKESLGLQFKVLGYAGALREENGLEWLMECVAKLPVNLSLLFVGRGPLEFRLRALAGDLGMSSRLKIIYDAQDGAYAQYFPAMDFIVFPSLSTPAWREPFNEVLFRAMKEGIPVIAANTGEIPYEAGDGALLIAEHDDSALGQAINRILTDPAFREELIQKGKSRAAQFNLEHFSASLIEFFKEILK